MPLTHPASDWTANTKIGKLRDLLDVVTVSTTNHVRGTRKSDRKSNCSACRAVVDHVLPRVGTDPVWTFNDRAGNPLPMRRQMGRFANLVREVHEHIVTEQGGRVTEVTETGTTVISGGSSEPSEYMGGSAAEEERRAEEVFGESETLVWEPLTEEEEHSSIIAEPIAAQSEMEILYSEHKRIRAELIERASQGSDAIDSLGYRPLKDGRAMIEAGIPARACLHAMTIDWDPAVRRQFGIADYDPATEFPGGLHGYIEALVEARVYIMLVGEAGIGKSFYAKHLAERKFDGRFGSLPCTEGATPSWLLGAQRLNGYSGTKFIDIWLNGGVFLLDEFDAMDANFGIMLNDGLANGVIHNPVSGETLVKSDDCVIIAAANTWGDGASRTFVRNELDPATRDRFRMGRVLHTYDDSIARLICGL